MLGPSWEVEQRGGLSGGTWSALLAEGGEILAARTCVEPQAEELRQEPAWASWVASIQAFGQLPGELRGKNEALLLAQAMNVPWGSCFGWSEHFDWDFKTVEHFCPETCACDISRAGNSACPRPLGRTCEQLNRCAIVDDAKVEVLDVDQYLQYQEQVMEAMVRLLVQVGGNGLEPWMIRDNAGRRLSGARILQAVDADWEYIMILANPEMSKFAIAANIESLEDAEATALYHSILAELGVPSPETMSRLWQTCASKSLVSASLARRMARTMTTTTMTRNRILTTPVVWRCAALYKLLRASHRNPRGLRLWLLALFLHGEAVEFRG
eukprot:s3415_g4.t1